MKPHLFTQLATRNECYQRAIPIIPRGILVHSTGANNPNLRRYVQPDDGRLGPNPNGNSMNQFRPGGRQVCPHAFIGRLADGTVATYQILPWTIRGWHSGRGEKGSANDLGYLGFELCEDDLSDQGYFESVYQEGVALAAYLCRTYYLDPLADGVLLCHSEAHKRGIASNHGDVMHWFPRHAKSMDTFRRDVAAALADQKVQERPGPAARDDDALTDRQLYERLQRALTYAATLPEPDWSRQEGAWEALSRAGGTDGTAPMGLVRRCELAAILQRIRQE